MSQKRTSDSLNSNSEAIEFKATRERCLSALLSYLAFSLISESSGEFLTLLGLGM